MKQAIKFSILTFSLFFITCKETKPSVEKMMINIYSGNYEIKSLNNQKLERKLFFTIDSNENKISGKTDCNTYFGDYVVTNKNKIEIELLGVTKMYCEDNVMKVESELFKAYSNTIALNFDNNRLTFFNKEGNPIVRAYKTTN
jgi:heat shock protein HslJ